MSVRAQDPMASRRSGLASRSGPIRLAPLFVALLLSLLAARYDPPRPGAGEDVYTIPPGTADRARAGQRVDDVLPLRVDTRVGRGLVVVNQDVEAHAFGPFRLEPGQRWSRRFARAGDVSLDCSVYPNTEFTISVAPADGPAGPAAWLLRAWALAWSLLVAACAARLGLAMARLHGARDRGGVTWQPSAIGRRDLAAASRWLAFLPATGLGLWIVGMTAHSRFLAPRDALLGAPSWAWLAAALIAAGLAWLPRRWSRSSPAVPGTNDRSVSGELRTDPAARDSAATDPKATEPSADPSLAGWILGALGGLVLAAALSYWALGREPLLPLALAVAGAGFLGGALIADRSRDRMPRPASLRLAASGLALVLAGLPWPLPNPPARIAFGLAVTGLALVLAFLSQRASSDPSAGIDRDVATSDANSDATAVATTDLRSAPAMRRGAAWLTAGTAGLLAFLGVSTAYGAAIDRADALYVPLGANPISPTLDSIDRGARLWSRHCADCHARPLELGSARDRDLIERITRPHADAPGFAYRLDLSDRGDVVNYLRSVAGDDG